MPIRFDIHVHVHGLEGLGLAEVLGAIGKLQKDVKKMSEGQSRLEREVAETRAAVTALTGRYQAKIDTMQTKIDELKAALESGDTAAANTAADELDALQTEMAGLATDTTGTDTTTAGGGEDTVGAGGGGDQVA